MLHEEVVRDEDGGDGSQDHPAFRPELMSLQRTRRNFEEAGLSLREEKDHGSPEGKQQDFIRQVDGEKVSLITYRAVK